MKNFTRFAVTAIIMLPFITSAATAAELQAQAQALLQQVASLQAQLGTQSGSTGGAYGTVISSANCPLIGRVLKRGSSGDDVSRLQKFLAADASIYPEGQITGYYGALTEAAVMRWQVRYNIVSSGTAATTGYGVTGPRTAAAISLQCSTATNVGAGNGPVGGFIQVSPVSGVAPMPVNVQATVNTTNSCTGATYSLDWGDGSQQQILNVVGGTCTTVSQSYTHTYIYGGTYLVTLAAGTHKSTATVVVSGPAVPSPTPVITQSLQFTVSPTSGASPLHVDFSSNTSGGSVDFGDGTTGSMNPVNVCSTCVPISTLNHTYSGAGTYTAKLVYQPPFVCNAPAGAACAQVMPAQQSSTVTITVTAPVAPATLGPLAVTPNVGGNPLAVQAQFAMNAAACTPGTTLSWGDGQAISSMNDAIPCSNTTLTYNHTYAGIGTYTITLTRGTKVDTASLTISN